MEKEYYFYTYRIDFSDGTFYIGSRKSKVPPEEDIAYLGSPVTHKDKWYDASLTKIKTIISESYINSHDMREHESELIKESWDDLFCLNENCGGSMSIEGCRLGGSKTGKINGAKKMKMVEFTSPEGMTFKYKNINEFCVLNNLDRQHILKCLTGKRKYHKGWTAKYIEKD